MVANQNRFSDSLLVAYIFTFVATIVCSVKQQVSTLGCNKDHNIFYPLNQILVLTKTVNSRFYIIQS